MSGRQAAKSSLAEIFLVLDENAFAFAAIQQLLRLKPSSTARLVFLYGPSGVGKSLLVRAYLRDLHGRSTRKRVAHFTAAEFAAELADASAETDVPQFQQKYRDADVLVCEDLASLENRYMSQQQLVTLVDEVLARGGECLFTSRVAPGEIPNLNVRLANRCHGGVCAGMEMPGGKSRVRLLNQFAQNRQVPIAASAVEMLADELPVSPRELSAAINQLDVLCGAEGRMIDADLVRRYLDEEIKPLPVTLPKIASVVAGHFGVTVNDIRTSSRARDQVLPRQCAMLLARQLTQESLGAIADYFGRRNHSTVIHACNRLEQQMSHKPDLRQHLLRIRRLLGPGGQKSRRELVENCATGGRENR